jgi:hypothetical protein
MSHAQLFIKHKTDWTNPVSSSNLWNAQATAMGKTVLLDRCIATRNQEGLACTPLLFPLQLVTIPRAIHQRVDITATGRLQPEIRKERFLAPNQNPLPLRTRNYRSPAVMEQELHGELLEFHVRDVIPRRRRRSRRSDIDIHRGGEAPSGASVPTPGRSRGGSSRRRRHGGGGPNVERLQGPLRAAGAPVLRSRRGAILARRRPTLLGRKELRVAQRLVLLGRGKGARC